jgi:hypothetical protein
MEVAITLVNNNTATITAEKKFYSTGPRGCFFSVVVWRLASFGFFITFGDIQLLDAFKEMHF